MPGRGAGDSFGTVTITLNDDESTDSTAPTVTSIGLQTPADSPANADTLTWRVTLDRASSSPVTVDWETVDPEGGGDGKEAMRAELSLMLAAAGARGELLEPPGAAGGRRWRW